MADRRINNGVAFIEIKQQAVAVQYTSILIHAGLHVHQTHSYGFEPNGPEGSINAFTVVKTNGALVLVVSLWLLSL